MSRDQDISGGNADAPGELSARCFTTAACFGPLTFHGSIDHGADVQRAGNCIESHRCRRVLDSFSWFKHQTMEFHGGRCRSSDLVLCRVSTLLNGMTR